MSNEAFEKWAIDYGLDYEPSFTRDDVEASWQAAKAMCEQSEPVAFIDDQQIPLYTSPPQPQTVKDALEKAAKICDDRAKYMKDMIMQDVVVGKADTGAMVCANAIRALIEKE